MNTSTVMTKKLGELTSYISKGIVPKYTEKISDETITVLNQRCNRNFKINYDNVRHNDLRKKKVPQDKYLKNGDVLINSTGVGTAGRVAQINNISEPLTVDGHMIILRPNSEIDPMYYGYALKSQKNRIETFAEGSTGQTEINRKRLCDEILISFPEDINEQKRIASKIKLIDDKINLNEMINDNLVA